MTEGERNGEPGNLESRYNREDHLQVNLRSDNYDTNLLMKRCRSPSPIQNPFDINYIHDHNYDQISK